MDCNRRCGDLNHVNLMEHILRGCEDERTHIKSLWDSQLLVKGTLFTSLNESGNISLGVRICPDQQPQGRGERGGGSLSAWHTWWKTELFFTTPGWFSKKGCCNTDKICVPNQFVCCRCQPRKSLIYIMWRLFVQWFRRETINIYRNTSFYEFEISSFGSRHYWVHPHM